jgi:hypothetical protein
MANLEESKAIKEAIRAGKTNSEIIREFKTTPQRVYGFRTYMNSTEGKVKKIAKPQKVVKKHPRLKAPKRLDYAAIEVRPTAAPTQMKLIMGSPAEIAAMLNAMGS